MARARGVAVLIAVSVLTIGCYTGSARDLSPHDIGADPGWVLVKGVPFVAQRSDDDCGAAALAMILSYHGRRTSRAAVLAEAPARDGGVTAGALRDVARRRGLAAFVVAGTWRDLEQQLGHRRPVMVGLVKPMWGGRALAHYEVVVGFNRARHLVASLDPARGWRENSAEGFAREWAPAGRVMLVVIPGTSPS